MEILPSLIFISVFIGIPLCLLLTPSGRSFLKSANVRRQQAKESLAQNMKFLILRGGGSNNAPPLIRLGAKLSRKMKRGMTVAATFAAVVIVGHILASGLSAQTVPPFPVPLTSLKKVSVPEPDNLNEFVKDKVAAIRLGKALFWDMQVGSDGNQSCATCHFHAGTDNRSKNQLHPGSDKIFNTGGKPNYQLKPEDYPFHKLSDPNDRFSTVLSDSNDVTGSQGITLTEFIDINPGSAVDKKTVQPDDVFNVNKINVRQVTGRNTPSAINAVFNYRNFWDGRAQNEFNGQNPFGNRDPNAFVLKSPKKQSQPEKMKISLKNASLASQAVGPPLNSVEESATGRIFPDVGQKFDSKLKVKKLPRETGKKLKSLTPLGKQLVASDDSVLGQYSKWPQPGLKQKSYEDMIEDAFKSEWWDSQYIIKIGSNNSLTFIKQPQGAKATDEFNLSDYNFPLFMGLAIQLYESTLVSDNAPIDQFYDGNSNALTAQQKQGLDIFQNKGLCINCHGGAEFTIASVGTVAKHGRIKRVPIPGPDPAQDTGFFNIGVRPTLEDLGVGGNDPSDNPLSETRLAQQGKFKQILGEDPPQLDPPLTSSESVIANGAFKTPGLRNVELTAPYMHNGGMLTLRQVIDFYSRGGDFGGLAVPDLEEVDKEALVAFMKALTDERVRNQSAPFDHPQLFIPNGHPGDQNSVTDDGTGQATDALLEIPAVGRNGGSPLPNFLATSPTTGVTPTSKSTPNSNPLEGSITQEDCPAGSTLQFVSGGYACMPSASP